MKLFQKSKSSMWHVFFYIIIIPLSLVTLLFTPYLIADIFGVNFDYVDINFQFQVIHIPLSIFLFLSLFSQKISALFFLFWINATLIFRFFQVIVKSNYGLNISSFIFDQINIENALIGLKTKYIELFLLIAFLLIVYFFNKNIIIKLHEIKKNKITSTLIFLLALRGIIIINTEWYRVHEQVSLILFTQKFIEYSEKKKNININFSINEIKLVNKNGVSFSEPKISEFNKSANYNIIHIIFESFQRNFTNIDKIRKFTWTPEIDSFLSNNQQSVIYNTLAPTVNSVIGLECGLWPQLSTHDLRNDDSYSYGKKCLGDFLNKIGYEQYYITGSTPKYANKDYFYRLHGFQNFIGRDEIFKWNIDYEKRRHAWGVQDIDLINFIIDWLEKKELNKFRLIVSTTNGHEPGYFDPECPLTKKSNHNYISVIRCVDFAFSIFLKWFKNSKYRENTIIIISGDHPAFLPGNNEIANLLVGQHGQMLFGFYHPKKQNIQIHTGSTNDLGPTILELLGFKVEEFRSGNSLLSRKKNFPEIFSHQIKIMDGKYVEVGHCSEKKLISWIINENNFFHDCSLEKIRRGLDSKNIPKINHGNFHTGN